MKKYKILVTILSALGIFTIMLTACHKNEHNKTVSEKYSANVKSNSSSEKSHEITSSVKQNASTVATSNYDKQSAKSVINNKLIKLIVSKFLHIPKLIMTIKKLI